MEALFILLLIYSVFLVCVTIGSWRKLLRAAKRNGARTIGAVATAIFVVGIAWELFGFIKNENGKSFTVGWFALGFFMIQVLSIYTFLCWLLVRFSK
ncbi:hypothetical protein [Dyadobacter sp. LHD-138]|uniref:hypothetical protein n=1 Tax=Dyadobacter sp. LHD-138 TaxID=3071413 RepID=UPI0027E0DE0A|nr:hypothetical protein [Dyadobacter sp. LHD-138]MDQ6481204.1 hypothetical protein [Dyadobacter sp. LHD-138]